MSNKMEDLAEKLAEDLADMQLDGLPGGSAGSITHLKFSDVDWDGLVRAGFVTRDEVNMMKMSDGRPVDPVRDSDTAKQYVAALLKLLRGVTSDINAQYLAVSRVKDVLGDAPQKTAGLFRAGNGGPCDVEPFMRAITSGDANVQQSAASSLALLLTLIGGDYNPLVNWVCDQLSTGRGTSANVRVAVQALSVLLRKEKPRLAFAHRGGVSYLNRLLRMQGGDRAAAQLLYELCFCLWSLSLCDDTRQDFMACGAIPTLAEQVKAAPREKVVRVALAALRHLTDCKVDGFNTEMIACGLPKTLKNMKTRHWTDPDIAADVDALYTRLQNNYRELSTFERYSQEVMSGQLRWGAVHTDKFWREHVRETEINDFFIVRQLVELLKSEDELVVSIACYDIGEFARFYPNGKAVVKTLSAKNTVMTLIEHPSADVRRHALTAVSKMMVNNWEFVR
ncbi:unnamed protein product [Phaeothamnion confervicola]